MFLGFVFSTPPCLVLPSRNTDANIPHFLILPLITQNKTRHAANQSGVGAGGGGSSAPTTPSAQKDNNNRSADDTFDVFQLALESRFPRVIDVALEGLNALIEGVYV